MPKYEIDCVELRDDEGRLYEPVAVDHVSHGEEYWSRTGVHKWYNHAPTIGKYLIVRPIRKTGWDWVRDHPGCLYMHKATGVVFWVRVCDLTGNPVVSTDRDYAHSRHQAHLGRNPAIPIADLSDDTCEILYPKGQDHD